MSIYPPKRCGRGAAHQPHDYSDPSVPVPRPAWRHCDGCASHRLQTQPEEPTTRPYGVYGATLPPVRVSTELRERIDARAASDDVAVADMIRTAVMEWLDSVCAPE